MPCCLQGCRDTLQRRPQTAAGTRERLRRVRRKCDEEAERYKTMQCPNAILLLTLITSRLRSSRERVEEELPRDAQVIIAVAERQIESHNEAKGATTIRRRRKRKQTESCAMERTRRQLRNARGTVDKGLGPRGRRVERQRSRINSVRAFSRAFRAKFSDWNISPGLNTASRRHPYNSALVELWCTSQFGFSRLSRHRARRTLVGIDEKML